MAADAPHHPIDIYGEMVTLIGEEAALALLRARGGGRVTIPAKARPDHWLVDLIGQAAADVLCAYYRTGSPQGRLRGIELDLPRGPTGAQAEVAATLARARQVMAQALASGASADDAARRAGLTRRSAYRMRLKGIVDPRQGRLL